MVETLEELVAQGKKFRIIVTGGAGLIGAKLAQYLLDESHNVLVIDNLSNSCEDAVPKGAKFANIDLVDLEPTVKCIVDFSPQIIYHAACHPYEGLSQFIPCDITLSTHVSTINMLVGCCQCPDMRRFVYFSSMARYGGGSDTEKPPFLELFQPRPEDIYAVAKVAAEESVKIMCNLHDIEWSIVVPHNVYGEANRMALSDPYRGVLLIWVNNLLRKKPFLIYGDGEQERAFSYVGDCVAPIARTGWLTAAKGEAFNIGAERHLSLTETAVITRRIFTEVTGEETPKFEYSDPRPCEVKFAYCSVAKSVDVLGYRDVTTIEEGLKIIVNWAKTITETGLEPRYLDKYEIVKKMPRAWMEKLI